MARFRLFGGAGLMAGQGARTMGKDMTAGRRHGVVGADQGPQQRRGLFGRARSFLARENEGVNNMDRLRLAAAYMRDDPSFASSAERGLAVQREQYRRNQSQQAEQEQAKLGQLQSQQEQRDEMARLGALEAQFGFQPGSLANLPEEARNSVIQEAAQRRFVPEEQEPQLREHNGNLYDFSDPRSPRLVMQGEQRPQERDMREDANGTLRFIDTGEPVFPDVEAAPSTGNFNTQQTMAAEYAARMNRANETLESITSPQDDPATPQDESAEGYRPNAVFRGRNIPLVGDALRGDQARQFDQAADEFALAVLRRESGAAISASERAEVAALYFPQPNDGPGVIAQKARARREVIDGMRRASGGAYDALFSGEGAAPSLDSLSDEELERIANGG